jgi:hypothetical protein
MKQFKQKLYLSLKGALNKIKIIYSFLSQARILRNIIGRKNGMDIRRMG